MISIKKQRIFFLLMVCASLQGCYFGVNLDSWGGFFNSAWEIIIAAGVLLIPGVGQALFIIVLAILLIA